MYTSLQTSEGVDVTLTIKVDGVNKILTHLAVTNVTAFDQINYYICNYAKTFAIYTDNATVGGTHPYYSYDSVSGSWVQAGTAEVVSSVPEDLISEINSGDFVLEQRTPSRGESDESSKYND